MGSQHGSTSAAASETPPSAVPFRTALRFWCQLGFMSFGGPAGQIALMHRELVERRRWISEERFLHALNFCMLLPGPEAQQLATYIGWLHHGVRGGIAAGVLFVLPGFLLITGIGILYVSFHELSPVQGILFGLQCAVLAVVLEAVLRIAKRALKNRLSWWVAAAAFVGIFGFGVPFPVIVLGAALLGFLVQRWRPASISTPANAAAVEPSAAMPQQRSTSAVKVLLVCGLLWFAPIFLVHAALGPSHVLSVESTFFSKMAVVTFGGAYAVLAYVAQEAVGRYSWLGPDDMLQGLALAETTPGPLILVLTFVGFVAAFRDAAPFDPLTAGIIGAVLTTWVTFVPCFLWIFLGAPHMEKLRQKRALSAGLAMVTAAVVGVILNLAVWFAFHALFREVTPWQGYGLKLSLPVLSSMNIPAVAIATFAVVAMLRFKVPMIPVLGICAAAGLAITILQGFAG